MIMKDLVSSRDLASRYCGRKFCKKTTGCSESLRTDTDEQRNILIAWQCIISLFRTIKYMYIM